MHVNKHYCAIVFTIQRGDACVCALSFSSTEATAMVILLSIIAQTYKHVAENSTVSNAQLTPTHPHEPFGSRVSAENLRWFFFPSKRNRIITQRGRYYVKKRHCRGKGLLSQQGLLSVGDNRLPAIVGPEEQNRKVHSGIVFP